MINRNTLMLIIAKTDSIKNDLINLEKIDSSKMDFTSLKNRIKVKMNMLNKIVKKI